MLYHLYLKDIPDFCRRCYCFTEMEEVRKCLSIIPEKHIEELRQRNYGTSKQIKLPVVKNRPEEGRAYVVESISPNGYWRTRSMHFVGDGVDLKSSLDFLVYEGGTWRGEAEIISYRPLEEGETVKLFDHFRNKRTGEHGPTMYPLDRKTVGIKHGLFKRDVHVLLKEFRDKEGAVLFGYQSWNPCYAKNIGGGRFEIVYDSCGNYGKDIPFRKEIGNFEDAVKHVSKEWFLDLLNLGGDAEQYIPPKPTLGWDHHQDYDFS